MAEEGQGIEDIDDEGQPQEFKDYLKDLFQDERLEVARFKNQERGDTEIIKKEQVIEKLERQNRMNRVAEELKDIDWNDRLKWVNRHKNTGNQFFKKQNYQAAADAYLEGLMGVEFQQNDPEKQKRMEQEQILPLLTNLATTMIRLEKYHNASALCDQALKIDEKSVKGNCKKGESLMYCQDYDKAVRYLKIALELSQSNEDKQSIYSIYQKLRELRGVEQKKYKGMFEYTKEEEQLQKELDDNQNNGGEDEGEEEEEEDEDDDDELDGSDDEEDESDRENDQEETQILYYDDLFQTITQYIGPISYVFYFPYFLYHKIAAGVLKCRKRRQYKQKIDQNEGSQETYEEDIQKIQENSENNTSCGNSCDNKDKEGGEDKKLKDD